MASIQQLLNEEEVNPADLSLQEKHQHERFMEELTSFLEKKGKRLMKIPVIGYKELDLFHLWKEVQQFGGFEAVKKKIGTWSRIWKTLENYDASITDASSRLKKIYVKYLLEYERWKFPERTLDSNYFTLQIKKRHKSTPSKEVKIPRLRNGEVAYPLNLSGGLTVHNVGKMVRIGEEEWPVGFQSSRTFSSYLIPQRHIQYTCQIQVENGSFQFIVTATDDPDNPVKAQSPSEAWKIILHRISDKNSDSNRNIPVSGPLRFGLLHPTVRFLLQEISHSPCNFTEMCNVMKRKNRKKRQLVEDHSDENLSPSESGAFDCAIQALGTLQSISCSKPELLI